MSLYSQNTDYIEVLMDTRSEKGVYFRGVDFDVEFYGADGKLLKSERFIFSGAQGELGAGLVYRKFFRHRFPSAATVKGGKMRYEKVLRELLPGPFDPLKRDEIEKVEVAVSPCLDQVDNIRDVPDSAPPAEKEGPEKSSPPCPKNPPTS